MVKKLIRVGDLTGVILEPEILRLVDVQADSEVEISVEGGAIVIRPCRYTDDANAQAAGHEVVRKRRRLLERLSK